MVCDCPTMPKRGVCVSTTRRSISSLVAGDQRVQRRGKAERGRVGRHVVHAAVGDQDGAGDAVGRHVGKRRRQRREQPRAVGLAVGRARFGDAHFQAGDALEPLDQRRARGFGLRVAVAEILARALVDDDGGDRGDRIAVFAGERRVGERQHHQSERQRPHRRAAAARQQQHDRNQHGRRRRPPTRRRPAPAERMRRRGSNRTPTVPAARAAPGYAPGRPCSCR